MCPILLLGLLAGHPPVIQVPVEVAASTQSGAKYAPERAVDGQSSTRWACSDRAPLPQWLEVRFPHSVKLDSLLLQVPTDSLYASWKRAAVRFSSGEEVLLEVEEGQQDIVLRFPSQETDALRVTIHETHQDRHYVGIQRLMAAFDPDRILDSCGKEEHPLNPSKITVRGRTDHPCVNITKTDLERARERVKRFEWARMEQDRILEAAEPWLEHNDSYWLSFLPPPGACYAYGFTGCPICGGKTGQWASAYCSWEEPNRVRCVHGHLLPDAEHPDEGVGYKAPDGRMHYFVGQFNAWVTEQWTLKALPSLSQAYALTGEERYAERGVLLLDALASIYTESTSGSWDYPSNPPSGRFARPWYQVARTLVKYVDQYDLLYPSSSLEEPSLRPGMTRRENIETFLLLDGARYCYEKSFSGALHNGHADYLRGALAVGCLMDIPEYVRIAVEGPFSIHTMLSNNIDRDGRYYETALGYAIHARNLYLTFADPLFNLKSEAFPEGINLYDDPSFEACLLLPDLQVQLAGRQPNFGDAGPDVAYKPFPKQSFSKIDYAFLERLYARTSSSEKRKIFAQTLSWLCQGDVPAQRAESSVRNWLLWHARDLPKGIEQALPPRLDRRVKGSWVAGVKGLALLRSGDQAALVRYGPSLNHGDPDDLGLLYYALGRQWTYDIGYGLGSTHTHVGWASSTVSHSLVTVNEKNQLEAPGSGGSLVFLADLPDVQATRVTSEASYASEGVSQYERTAALVRGKYLLDLFRVTGGHQHDYSFGSVGEDVAPFGVKDLQPQEGSLAKGAAWGERIENDGDIQGFPNKPYWNPPPGNGYGFFHHVQRGEAETVWGASWPRHKESENAFRLFVTGDPAEPVFASAPGLYPRLPKAGFLLAKRTGKDPNDGPLQSAFLSVMDPGEEVDRIVPLASDSVEVYGKDGTADVILCGPRAVNTLFGKIAFQGAFCLLHGTNRGRLLRAQVVSSSSLLVNDEVVHKGSARWTAQVTSVNLEGRSLTLSEKIPSPTEGLIALVSHPARSRSSAFHVGRAEGDVLFLEAATLVLGKGRVQALLGPRSLLCDIPHEYAKTVKRAHSTLFFDGVVIRGDRGQETRVTSTSPGFPLRLEVEDATLFAPGDRFLYLEVTSGDTVAIPMARFHEIRG